MIRFLEYLEYLARHQEDDETYTAAQQERDIEAAAEIEHGKGVPHEDVLRDFGISDRRQGWR